MVPAEALVDPVPPPRTLTLRVGGIDLIAAVHPDGRVRVERLLSTDPAHFLEPSLQPGSDVTAAAAGSGLAGGALEGAPRVVDGPPLA